MLNRQRLQSPIIHASLKLKGLLARAYHLLDPMFFHRLLHLYLGYVLLIVSNISCPENI